MAGKRGLWLASALAILGGAAAIAAVTHGGSQPSQHATSTGWAQQRLHGNVQLTGQVPLVVRHARPAPARHTPSTPLPASSVPHPGATYLHPHPKTADIGLNFAFPLRNRAALDQLIAQEAKTHRYLTRAQLYARFSPPPAQFDALQAWLARNGFRITHLSPDRLAITVHAPTAVVERALHVRINDYLRSGFTFRNIKVQPFQFYANTTAPRVPARLGLQSISGLSDIDRFYTNYRLGGGAPVTPDDPDATDVRSGGYFPADLRGLYDITGHGVDATGQTIGFTLWTAPEHQAAMTTFANTTGDQPITVDPSCAAVNNSPTEPSSCTSVHVAPDHLLTILENGNTDANANFGSNVETALDIEAAHGVATGVAMKYYASECNGVPAGSGLANAGCNGSDVGLEDAIEDAANDPTLHSVSNSWGFGGEAEWGAADPFLQTAQASFALAAAAGTTFYFSTGDSGTYQSGFPSDSQYVVSVGGTSLYSTANPGTYSTATTWSGSGSWCSNVIARPSWQTGSGVAANAQCPGRVIPDVSAVADPNTGVRYTRTANLNGGTSSGQVGGTSLAAPVMNGLEAMTESFLKTQSFSGGSTPAVGFVAPMLYQLGNSGNADRYYRDVVCGNTANPTSGPDGDAARRGWDAATGWGEPDWFHFSVGYAIALGATGLSQPSSLATSYPWSCAKTPSNSTERGLAFPTSSTGYAVGAASGGTPWPGKFLPSGAWGAVNTFFKTSDGGATWFPSNSDMLSVACTSSSTCVEVGVGGRARRTTDGGSTWSDVATGYDKPLTQVTCPSASVCYAVGDRGTGMKSSDGGSTWAFLPTTGANPLYGLSCPDASTCYATDIYAHVLKTSDGGATWTWQQTPITTPGVEVPGSGGPAPFAGLLAISCPDDNTCVATGLYASVAGQTVTNPDPPIVTTTDGGATWTRQASNAGTGNYLHAVSCLPGTTTCTAVGRGGTIVTTSNLVSWTKAVSGTTTLLDGVACSSASSCIAVGQNGTVDVLSGGTWTASTGNGGTGILAGIACTSATACVAVGKQGVTIATTNGGGAWSPQAGGGTTQQMNSISCVTADACVTVGNGGTILKTTNGGQLWSPQTSGTGSALNGASCVGSACVAVGAGGTALTSSDGGSTWAAGTSGTTNALNGVTCGATSACVAVGAAGTIITSADAGATWAAHASGTTNALNAVACAGGACYAAGAAGTILKSADGGATWAAQTSGTTQTLSGIACLDASNCFADGAIGTVVSTTDGGATWTQQGDPLSGPTSALNITASAGLALNGIACSPLRCDVGGGTQSDILTSPLLVVTVKATATYGDAVSLSGLAPSNPALTYSVPAEAGNVSGTLTCTTTATTGSPAGTYPIAGCGGLSDAGYSVVYDYADSAFTIKKAVLTVTADNKTRLFGSANPPLTATITGFVNNETLATSGVTGSPSCTTPATPYSAVGTYAITCTTGTLAATNYSFTFVPGTLTVNASSPCTSGPSNGKVNVAAGQVACFGPGTTINGPVTISAGGAIDIEGATITGPLRIDGTGVVRICGTRVTGPLSVTGATGLVLIGGDAATGACAGNTFTGPVDLTSNKGGVEFNGNTVTGPLTISKTTGTVPAPDTGAVHAEGNTVSGPSRIG